MKITPTILINAVLATVLLSSILFVGLTSSIGVYDPYADYDADGDIDIFDVVPMADAYGTNGDPSRNVTVTNWPTGLGDGDYSYFAYRVDASPVVYTSVDSMTYASNSTVETTIANFTIDGAAFLSTLSLEPLHNLWFEVKTEFEQPVYLSLYCYINGELHRQGNWTTNANYQTHVFAALDIDENRTDNHIRISFNSTLSGKWVWIRYIEHEVQHRYRKTELTPQDFGSNRAYIASIWFEHVTDIIAIDSAMNQTITCNAVGADVVEFREKIWFNHIEFIRGAPTIEVYAEKRSD